MSSKPLVLFLLSLSLALGPVAQAKSQAQGPKTRVSTRFRADDKEFAVVQAAIYHHVGKTGGVIDFMTKMAKDGHVVTDKGNVTLKQFETVWKDKNDSNWVENKFRAVDKNKHEWIPSNYMVKVIERARTSREGMKWITLQDQMRSPTNLILFTPGKWDVVKKDGKPAYVPQGHTGAAFDKETGYPLTEHQAEFHDELRKVFDSNATVHGVIGGMKDVVNKWVWNGEPLKYPIAPTVVTHDKKSMGTPSRAAAAQKANYDAIMEMLEHVEKAISTPSA